MKVFTIKNRQDFLKIQHSCKNAIKTKTILLLYKKTDEKRINFNTNINEFVRIGFSVSKRVSKLAVIRNKIKRLLRESIRKILNENSSIFTNFFDYEIIVKKEILNYNFQEISTDILSAFSTLKTQQK